MGFRLRLALFLVATLVIVQSLTAVLVYEVTRRALIAEGERQLSVAASAFVRQLDDMSQRVADNVQVLALDYALRAAIAQRDRSTVLSALRNHGRRVGASRMLLIDLDGSIDVDTNSPQVTPSATAGERANATGATFPFPDLIKNAFDRRAAAVVALDERAYWMVVVPVYAPQPIALIAVGIPIDDQLLARMQQLSTLPKEIELVSETGPAAWTVVARGDATLDLSTQLTRRTHELPSKPTLVDVGGREFVALAIALTQSERSAPMSAVLGYSLDDALRPYRSVGLAWASLLGLGLLAGVLGALLIARGVSRPVETLAASARRIEAGDYAPLPALPQGGEIGQLSTALSKMTQAIAVREEHIRFQADHDSATQLPNRQAAEATIQKDLVAHPSRDGVLLMIGLARLPEIIQTMGHAIGDRLMRNAAERVRRIAGDHLAARATDTQFLIWLSDATKADGIALAFRILDIFGESYQEADLAIDFAPAVGLALCPQHGVAASALLQHAEVALFAALGSDDPVVVYDRATDPHRPERLSLMGDLREALDGNALSLHYQARLHLGSATMDSAEALVRWRHVKYGDIAPDAFIGLAEETGNIRRLTRWVLASGIAQAQRWNTLSPGFRVALNLSARDLEDAQLPQRVSELLTVHRVLPDKLILEITESAMMGKPDAAIRVLKRLADMGLDLAIDDFGVGQSSFAYLRRLPVREIKIDRSFVRKLGEDTEDQTIVASIVELGHRLGYRVTAEGVETQTALNYLTVIGCDHAQGFFLAKPMPARDFEAFVSDGRWRAPDAT